MRVYLVRHGQSEHNRDGILQGQAHSRLTAQGHDQAMRAARGLRRIRFDAVYSSDLGRCRETVAHIRQHGHARVRYSTLLRERDVGAFQGKERCVMHRHRLRLKVLREDYRPPGGETFGELRNRAARFLALLSRRSDTTVLVVTHGGFIRMFLSVVFDLPLGKAIGYPVTNASVTVVELGKKPMLVRYNDARHLKKRLT